MDSVSAKCLFENSQTCSVQRTATWHSGMSLTSPRLPITSAGRVSLLLLPSVQASVPSAPSAGLGVVRRACVCPEEEEEEGTAVEGGHGDTCCGGACGVVVPVCGRRACRSSIPPSPPGTPSLPPAFPPSLPAVASLLPSSRLPHGVHGFPRGACAWLDDRRFPPAVPHGHAPPPVFFTLSVLCKALPALPGSGEKRWFESSRRLKHPNPRSFP